MPCQTGEVAGLRIVLPLVLGACSSEPICDVEELVSRELGDAVVTDCGRIHVTDSPGSPPALEAARDCVQAALDAREPFVVVWSVEWFEGTSIRAFVRSVPADVSPAITHFGQSPTGTGQRVTGRTSCDGLAPLPTCSASLLKSHLCFECIPGEQGERLCHE